MNRLSDGLSIGSELDRGEKQQELPSYKSVTCKLHVRILLKDVLGIAEHQQKAVFGLGYKLTLTEKKDEAVLDKAAGTADARIEIDHIDSDVPPYTASIPQHGL